MGSELLRQFASLGVEVHDDDRFDAPAGERGDRGEADRSRPDDDGHLAGLDVRAPHVELADREGIDDSDGVVWTRRRARPSP